MKHYFGHLDANNADEIKKLRIDKAFIITDSIDKALSDSKCFVCGRRGSGKTAVAQMLSAITAENNEPKYHFTEGLKENDYSSLHGSLFDMLLVSDLHTSKDNTQERLEKLYYYIWTYILHITIIQAAAQTAVHKESHHSDAKDINNYLQNINALCSACTHVFNFCREIMRSGDSVSHSINIESEIRNRLESVSHRMALENANNIMNSYNIAIYIDTLEKYRLDEFNIHPIRGMCEAIKDLHETKNHKNVHIKCFLPAEMSDHIFSSNHAKYEAYSTFLKWSYTELIHLMEKRYCIYIKDFLHRDKDHEVLTSCLNINSRIENAVSKDDPVSPKELRELLLGSFWRTIAPSQIINKYGWEEESCSYIIRHTQKRPREVITCMNYITEEAINSGNFPKFSDKNIYNGVHNINCLKKLLTDNLAVYNIAFDGGAPQKLAANTLAGSSIVFTGKQLNNICKAAYNIIAQKNIDSPQIARRMLINCGLLGQVIESGGKPYNQWVEGGHTKRYYCAQYQYILNIDVPINDACTYAVHPMLADYLHLDHSDKTDFGIVYPYPDPDELDLIEELSGAYHAKTKD